MRRYCIHCLKEESDLCSHEFAEVPDECVCDLGNWEPPIPPVCDKYEGDGKQYCRTCEHDKDCHQPCK